MTRRFAILAAVVLASPLIAQTNNYQPPTTDTGRVPVFQQPNPQGSKSDDNRIPVLQGAGSFGTIQSFPETQTPGGLQEQYIPPQPRLSPYLNLLRGSSRGGLSAIDYYNIVRPGQQSLGSYSGRPMGAAPGFGGRFGGAVDPETGLQASGRSAGTPAVFQSYGNYFNRLGTIGAGQGAVAAPSNAGRR